MATNFQDLMSEIEDLDLNAESEKAAEPSAEKDTPGETPGTDEAPQDTPPEAPAKADEKAGAEDTVEAGKQVSDEPAAPPEGKPEDTAVPPVDLVTIGGKQYTPEQAETLLKSGERYTELQGEFTRRNQDAAKQREAVEDRNRLLVEMEKHEGVQDLVSRHPKVIRYLLSDPASTRALMGDAKQLESFVNDYGVLEQNPSLAERFAAGPQSPETQRELGVQRAQNFMDYVGGSVDNAIAYVLKGADGSVTREDVEGYLKELVSLDPSGDPAQGLRSFHKLHSLMFVPAASGNGEEVDVSLLQKFVSSRRATQATSTGIKNNKADAHNQRVDQALKAGKETRPPVLAGSSPGATQDQPKVYKSFHEVLQDITD